MIVYMIVFMVVLVAVRLKSIQYTHGYIVFKMYLFWKGYYSVAPCSMQVHRFLAVLLIIALDYFPIHKHCKFLLSLQIINGFKNKLIQFIMCTKA